MPTGLHDPLSLRPPRFGPVLRLADIDVSTALRDGTMNSAVNDLPSARLTVDSRLLAGQPVDYFGSLEFGTRHGSTSVQPLFSGHITTARPDGTDLRIDARTHAVLLDSTMPGFQVLQAHPGELLHLLTRMGGLPEEQINVPALETELPLEIIEVVVPLLGIEVEGILRLGALVLLPSSQTAALRRGFADSPMVDEVWAAQCHALYRFVGRGAC